MARVARIRELQTLLGLNLDEIAVVLRNDDRLAEIKAVYHDEHTGAEERRPTGSRVPRAAGATSRHGRSQAGCVGHVPGRRGCPYSARSLRASCAVGLRGGYGTPAGTTTATGPDRCPGPPRASW